MTGVGEEATSVYRLEILWTIIRTNVCNVLFFRLFRNLRMYMFQFFKLLSYLWLHWMARLFEGWQTPVNVRRDTFRGTFPWEVNWLSLNDIINFCHVFLVNLQTFLVFLKWITVVAIDKEMSRSTAYWQKRIRYVPSRNQGKGTVVS